MPEQFKLPFETPTISPRDNKATETNPSSRSSIQQQNTLKLSAKETPEFKNHLSTLDATREADEMTYTDMFAVLSDTSQDNIAQHLSTALSIGKAIIGAYQKTIDLSKYGITDANTPSNNQSKSPRKSSPKNGLDFKSRAAGDDSMKDV